MTREEAAKIIDPEMSSETYWEREDSGTADGVMRWENDVYEACAIAADALRNQGGRQDSWISVRDRLPERFEPVLVCREKNGSPYVEQGYKDVGEWWKVYGTRTKQITHWMPLPEPPEEVAP